MKNIKSEIIFKQARSCNQHLKYPVSVKVPLSRTYSEEERKKIIHSLHTTCNVPKEIDSDIYEDIEFIISKFKEVNMGERHLACLTSIQDSFFVHLYFEFRTMKYLESFAEAIGCKVD